MSDVPVAERASSADSHSVASAGSARRSARSVLEAAAALHRSGAFAAAAAGYRAVLARRPDDIDALQLLGAAEVALGRAADALPRLQRALALCPEHAAAHNHHGLALAALGRFGSAEAAFDAATRHAPGLVPAWVNLAATRVQRGASVPAIDAARRALALDPSAHDARVPLGTAWLALGDAAEAAQVLGAVPADAACAAEACLNLGHAWRALGRLDDARLAYDRGLAALATAAPRADASLHGSLLAHAALLALDRGDSAAAATGAQHALQVAPADNTASRVLARALRRLGCPAEALVVLDALLGARPDDAIAWQERAQSALALQRVDDALDAYTRALALAPQQPWLFGQWLHTKLKACDWDGLEPAFQRLAHGLAAGEPLATPFQVLLTPLPPSSQQQAAQVFRSHVTPVGRVADWDAAAPRRRDPGERRLRVAYVSGDWHDHPTMQLVTPVLRGHDRRRVEVIVVALGPRAADGPGAEAVACAERVLDLHGVDDAQAVRRLRALAIDVAIDLNGSTHGARPALFSQRVAPLQLAYLGHPGVAGAGSYDYSVADPVVAAGLAPAPGVEAALVLPHCYLTGGLPPVDTEAPSRAALGLPDDAVVFCCSNHAAKILPGTFDCWLRMLQACPSSVLWLRDAFDGAATARWRATAAARGIDPARIVVMQQQARARYRAQLARADLFVDTWPYNAHTTGLEALSAGLPLLTRTGTGFAGRVGASLVRAAGLPELVTHHDASYVAEAVALAHDRPRLQGLRARLVQARSPASPAPLFDVRAYVDAFERGLQAAWRRHVDGLAPIRLDVASSRSPGSAIDACAAVAPEPSGGSQMPTSLPHSSVSETSPGKGRRPE